MARPHTLRPEQRKQDEIMYPTHEILRSPPVFRLRYKKDRQGRMQYMKDRRKVHGKNEVYENVHL